MLYPYACIVNQMHPRFIVVKKLGEELTIFNTLSIAVASEARTKFVK